MVLQPLHADSIGDITELKGYGQIVRDEPYPAVLDFNINSYDDVQTRAGRIAITFLDNSTVKLTEHSNLTIDEYIYDPDPSKSKMALQFASGTIRFVSGNLNKESINLATPTANIAVRGTDFTCTVTETGSSLIILLPNEFGDASGEIVVSTALGEVVLNQPYQATTTTVFEQAPSKPVTLDITLDMIDNMLIVAPPKEEVTTETTNNTEQTDLLDYNDLDIDLLKEDLLAEEDLEFNELDIDYLDVNFLQDLLDVLTDLDQNTEEDQLANVIDGVDVVGTKIGQDPDTQIITILEGDKLKIIRKVNQGLELLLNSDNSYRLVLSQDGITNTVKVNNGSSTNIEINQTP